MSDIHPSAIIHPQAEIGANVEIGPYSVVHDRVRMGAGCRLAAHCVVHAGVVLGPNNQLSDHAVIGGAPQDRSLDPALQSGVEIGANNHFREFTTVHRSTTQGQCTQVGSNGFFMFSSHIAHDCMVEDGVTLASYTALAGHVQVGEKAFLSGHVLVHQHARIGRLSMIAGLTPVARDVLPFTLLGRSPAVHYSLNRVGLQRSGIEGDRYQALADAWRHLRSGGSGEELEDNSEEVRYLKAWLAQPSERGLCAYIRPGEH